MKNENIGSQSESILQ